MVLYEVQAFNSFYAGFDPRVIPASVQQVVVPYVRIPDGTSHTYKLVFHLFTAGTTTTHYQLDTRTPVAVAAGAATLEFTDTTPATSSPTTPSGTPGASEISTGTSGTSIPRRPVDPLVDPGRHG
jgi:hypothetical protein